MAHCIHKANPEYQKLLKLSGLKDPILSAKIAVWQEANNKMDSFPTLNELLLDNSKSTSVPFQKVVPKFKLQDTLKKQFIQEGLIDVRGNIKDYPKMLTRNREVTEELAAAHNIPIDLRERVFTLSGRNNEKATLNHSFLNKINQKFSVEARAKNKLSKIVNETQAENIVDYTQSQRGLNYDISRNTGILSGDIRGKSTSISTSLSTSFGGESTPGLEKGYLFPTGSNGGNSDSFKSKISGKTYKEIWTSKQFTDNEKRDALLMFLNQELLSPDSFNGKLFSKITSELGQVGTFLVNDRLFYAKQDSINLNLQAFYNGLKQANPIDIEGSIKHILYEELIHVLTYKITTTEDLDAIVKEQGFLMLEKAVEDAYNSKINISNKIEKGRVLAHEYLRMLIQQDTQQTGSELILQGAKLNLIAKLKEAWQFLKDIVKPKTREVVDRHIAFINKKLEDNFEISDIDSNIKALTEPLTLHKGLGGKYSPSGARINPHYGVKGRFFSEDYNIAKEYDGGKGILTEILPVGGTIERIDVRRRIEYLDDLRPTEINTINSSKAEIVELHTIDGDGEAIQYIIMDTYLNNIKLRDYFKGVEQTAEISRIISEIDKILPQYPIHNAESLINTIVEVPEFTQDLQNSPGTRFPYVNLHKELSTVLLQAKGVIPNTEAYYGAMEMFGYENKPFIFAESNVQSDDAYLENLLQDIKKGLPNTPILRPEFRTYFNPPLLLKRAQFPLEDTQKYVSSFNNIQETLGQRTFSELENFEEYSRDEWSGILLYALEQALRQDISVSPETIDNIKDFIKERYVISFDTIVQYNNTPEIWEVAENIDQFIKFKKEYSQPENTEELIKDFREFAQLEQANIKMECL